MIHSDKQFFHSSTN